VIAVGFVLIALACFWIKFVEPVYFKEPTAETQYRINFIGGMVVLLAIALIIIGVAKWLYINAP
jgi:hypothetical protein